MATLSTPALSQYILQKIRNRQPLVFDEIIFANIPGLTATNLTNHLRMPSNNQIVHRQVVSQVGYVNDNAVVYSVTLGTEVGNFNFNFIGLVNRTENMLAVAVQTDTIQKIRNQNNQQGNSLTRSILLEFNGARQATNITIPAQTWQIDFTVRLHGLDEKIRLTNFDLYGDAIFFDDGFMVQRGRQARQYSVQAGNAYIKGVRASVTTQNLTQNSLPVTLYADVAHYASVTGSYETHTIIASNRHADYVDSAGYQHYVAPIARIESNGEVTDLRQKFGFIPNSKKSSAVNSNSADTVATSAAVKTAYDKAVVAQQAAENIRMKFVTVRSGSQAVTLDATKRSDWFREMQIPESGGWGYYVQAFHNSGTQHVYSNFPLNGRFHFTAEVFHSAGFSHVRITYPSQNRVFETAVNFNQEDLMLDWREVVLVKDGVHQGNFMVKGSLVSDYRLRVERNDVRYPPYLMCIDASVDISRDISANKVIGEYFCNVKDGENDRAKSVFRTGIITDGNVFTELGQWNAENRYQVTWKSFSKTNNTVIGKTTDNERDRLQVNGTIQATAPETEANNDQVPTTAWVRKLAKLIADSKLDKAGGTMTGNLELKVGDYSWISQYNTAGKQARIETLPDNEGNFYKVSQRSNNGQTEYHSAFFPKRGMGKIVAYEDWTISLFEYQKIGNFEIRKYPDGTMIQTCRFTPQHNRFVVQMSNNNTLIWPIAFYETPKVWAQYINTDSNEFGSTDSTISINHRNSNKTKVVFSVYEIYHNNLEASIDFLAIGRWK